jgi:acyl carrier protein
VNALSEDRLVDLVVRWAKQNTQKGEAAGLGIDKDTDLIASGLLDSFGFVDLIMYLESEAGCRVDLIDADPSEFSVVKGLCRLALKNHRADEDGNGQLHYR